MNNKKILLVLSAFFVLQAFAQKQITCSTQRNQDGTYSILADSKAFADCTIKLTFTELTGYQASVPTDVLVRVGRGTTQIAKLTPAPSSTQRSFNYKYGYFPGVYLRKAPDTSFVYVLPSTVQNTLKVTKVSSLEEKLGRKSTEEFHAIGFGYKLGDTICAARAGLIYECNNDVDEGEKLEQAYNSNRNKISMEHRDGTMGYYSILAPVKLLIQPGDKVIPGQPIAVFNKESPKYHVLFSVFYLDEHKLRAKSPTATTQSPSYYTNIPVKFYVPEYDKAASLQINTAYKVVQPKEIVAIELSKKEKKTMGW